MIYLITFRKGRIAKERVPLAIARTASTTRRGRTRREVQRYVSKFTKAPQPLYVSVEPTRRPRAALCMKTNSELKMLSSKEFFMNSRKERK